MSMSCCIGPDDDAWFNEPVDATTGRRTLHFSGRRRYVRFPAVELELVKRVGKALGGASVNDVVLAALTGAWRRYGSEVVGDQQLPDGKRKDVLFKALIPVALPRPVKDDDAGPSLVNHWVLASVPLPLGEPEPGKRVVGVRDACRSFRTTGWFGVSQCCLDYGPRNVAPLNVQQKAAAKLFGMHSMMVTNVPGPGLPVWLGGALLEEYRVVFSGLLPQVAFVSYASRIYVSMLVDPKVVADSSAFCACWTTELAALEREAESAAALAKVAAASSADAA